MPEDRVKYNPLFDEIRGAKSIGDGAVTWLTMRDGTRIFMQEWHPSGTPRKAVVCFHGAGGQGQYFALIADILTPRGASVFVADYRGHGMSEGPRGDYKSFQQLLDDCHEVVLSVRKRMPGVPITILGESMGGAMAINYAAQHPEVTTGLVLFSPALQFIKSAMPLAQLVRLPYYLLSMIFTPGKAVIKMSGQEHLGIKHPTHVEFDKTDQYHLTHISPRYFFQLNKYMNIGLNECPSKIKAPTIIFQGGADPGIDPAGAKLFLERLASTDKEIVIYPKGLHVLLTDPDCPDIGERLAAWFEKQ
jgi:alpha-beta hydrolase superfamily lysophospholipase